ncbi:MAG TPA: nucleotidyltransferase domain-containing protein [Chloroflexia bacterium]|jgi:predicted nucleotidyltransferase
MAQANIEVELERIQKVVQQIVEHFHPAKVILFGSHAYGVPTEDSDVDLLVIMDAGGSTLRAAATISATIDHPFPLDILVLEPNQLQASLERGGIFAADVTTNGVVLYES